MTDGRTTNRVLVSDLFTIGAGQLMTDSMGNEIGLPLGISENTHNKPLVYPNPTSENIYIDCQSPFEYDIYDVSGRLVKEGESMGKGMISLSDLSKDGIYFIVVRTRDKVLRERFLLLQGK